MNKNKKNFHTAKSRVKWNWFFFFFFFGHVGKPVLRVYVLSCGTVTAISRWDTYKRPTGPTTFVEMVSSCDAESRSTGWLRYSVLVSGGGSSWTTPCTTNTILRETKGFGIIIRTTHAFLLFETYKNKALKA